MVSVGPYMFQTDWPRLASGSAKSGGNASPQLYSRGRPLPCQPESSSAR